MSPRQGYQFSRRFKPLLMIRPPTTPRMTVPPTATALPVAVPAAAEDDDGVDEPPRPCRGVIRQDAEATLDDDHDEVEEIVRTSVMGVYRQEVFMPSPATTRCSRSTLRRWPPLRKLRQPPTTRPPTPRPPTTRPPRPRPAPRPPTATSRPTPRPPPPPPRHHHQHSRRRRRRRHRRHHQRQHDHRRRSCRCSHHHRRSTVCGSLPTSAHATSTAQTTRGNHPLFRLWCDGRRCHGGSRACYRGAAAQQWPAGKGPKAARKKDLPDVCEPRQAAQRTACVRRRGRLAGVAGVLLQIASGQ